MPSSVYRKYQSTEMALVRVHNNELTALDSKKVVSFILFDLSAVFDTIDHIIG